MLASSLMLQVLLAAMTPAAPASLAASRLPFCTDAQLLLPEQSGDQRPLQPPSQVPTVRYPHGTRRDEWGLYAYFRVEADGRIACVQPTDENGDPVQLTPERVEALDRMAAMRFVPFAVDGQPIAARVAMLIPEEEVPERHLPLPRVPLPQVRMRLEHTGCMGTCAMYSVEVAGDGRVRYEGENFVDVLGVQEYRISTAAARQLVRQVDALDLWSLRDDYQRAPDAPGITLVLTFGDKQRTIKVDSFSATRAVDTFAEAMDAATLSARWRRLTPDSLRALESQHFDFASEAGSDLLVCAASNAITEDEGLLLRLLALGASPVRGSEACQFPPAVAVTPLEAALAHGRDALVAALVARGALGPPESLDQAQLDRLFLAAVRGGRLAGVQALWNAAAPRRPSLRVQRRGYGKSTPEQDPILFELPYYEPARVPGVERAQVAKWLQSQGADLQARGSYGRTLLHVAAEAGDAALARTLLDAGLDPGLPNQSGEFAFRWAQSEAAAVAILEAVPAQARTAAMYEQARQLLRERRWPLLAQWLSRTERLPEAKP